MVTPFPAGIAFTTEMAECVVASNERLLGSDIRVHVQALAMTRGRVPLTPKPNSFHFSFRASFQFFSGRAILMEEFEDFLSLCAKPRIFFLSSFPMTTELLIIRRKSSFCLSRSDSLEYSKFRRYPAFGHHSQDDALAVAQFEIGRCLYRMPHCVTVI